MRRTSLTPVPVLAWALLGAFSLAVSGAPAQDGGAKKSDAVVKASVAAAKPDTDGKQVVTVTLAIDPGWHIYANPPGLEDLAAGQTTVSVTGKTKPKEVKVDYPAGKVIKDTVLGEYLVYEDKVTIKATVHRAPKDSGPLEVAVKFQACNDKMCFLPATVKLMVP